MKEEDEWPLRSVHLHFAENNAEPLPPAIGHAESLNENVLAADWLVALDVNDGGEQSSIEARHGAAFCAIAARHSPRLLGDVNGKAI